MQVTDSRDKALSDLSKITGIKLFTPLTGTEPVPKRLQLDLNKLKAYLDSQLGIQSECR